MPGHWTRGERRSLYRQIVEETRDIKEVRIRGRDYFGIRKMAIRLGYIKANPARPPWPRRQKRLLRELKGEGYTPTRIHDMDLLGEPNKSLDAIVQQWKRCKLSNRKISRRLRRKKRWDKATNEKERFLQFLREHSHDMTPEQIGKIWRVAPGTVSENQHKLGLKASWAEVMAMPFSVAKRKRSKKKAAKKVSAWAKNLRQKRIKKLEQLALVARSRTDPLPERTCSDCETSWPLHQKFFPVRIKRLKHPKMTSVHHKHRCTICCWEVAIASSSKLRARKRRARRKAEAQGESLQA